VWPGREEVPDSQCYGIDGEMAQPRRAMHTRNLQALTAPTQNRETAVRTVPGGRMRFAVLPGEASTMTRRWRPCTNARPRVYCAIIPKTEEVACPMSGWSTPAGCTQAKEQALE
jgi:hypothetical protein